MGYATALAPCLLCKQTFSFNPIRVPSLRVKGTREPICEPCMAEVNRQRVAKGIHPLPIHPEAYQPCNEEELIYNDED